MALRHLRSGSGRNESVGLEIVAATAGIEQMGAKFGTSERFWLGLQADHDLEEAHRTLGKKVAWIERVAA